LIISWFFYKYLRRTKNFYYLTNKMFLVFKNWRFVLLTLFVY